MQSLTYIIMYTGDNIISAGLCKPWMNIDLIRLRHSFSYKRVQPPTLNGKKPIASKYSGLFSLAFLPPTRANLRWKLQYHEQHTW